MTTRGVYPDNIDLDFIAKDCVLKNTTGIQVISGPKTFVRPLHLRSMEAKSRLNVKMLNNIDILRFNASLYRLSSGEMINSKLNFRTPALIGRLEVAGLINGVRTAQIYDTKKGPLPPIRMQSLIVDDALQIENINDMSLNYMLENRITKAGQALEVFGFLTFENLILKKDIMLQTINGIPMDNLVFKRTTELQAITGTKTILGDLVLLGPVNVMRLNDQDLLESYQQSVFTKRNHEIEPLLQTTFFDTAPENELEMHKETANHFENDEQFMKLNDTAEQQIANNALQGDENSHLLYLDYDFDAAILWQMPNETIDQTYSYEIERLSMCERRLLYIQKSPNHRRLYLNNRTTSFITANAHNFSMKAENFCKSKYRKVKSKITIAGSKLSKVFGMRRYIENVQIFSPDKDIFVLLHAIDMPTGRNNEVRLLKINYKGDNISDWQSIVAGVGGSVVRLYQLANNETIILSAGIVKNQPAISIYRYVLETQQFELLQIIIGDYDIIEMVALEPKKYHLILSCYHCQRLNIYEYSPTISEKYEIFQMLKFKSLINKLLAFVLNADGSWYLLILSENAIDYYHLYKYTPTHGWLQSTYGYFHNIKMAIPLIDTTTKVSDGRALMLLCNNDKCNLVKAVVH